MAWGKANISSGGGQKVDKSIIIITAPTGSIVSIEKDGKKKTVAEKNGTWTFSNVDSGIWTLYAEQGEGDLKQSTTETKKIDIPQFYYIELTYGDIPKFKYFIGPPEDEQLAQVDKDYQVVQDDDTKIENIGEYKGNWKIRFLSSGTLKILSAPKTKALDVFLVGGGGNGGTSAGSDNPAPTGGCGGYTKTHKNILIDTEKNYNIEIGLGGSPGGTTVFDIYNVPGGDSGGSWKRGFGGSGGGGYPGNGGSNGNNGLSGSSCAGGYGQRGKKEYGYGTREFNEPGGKLYSGGGGGSSGTGGSHTAGGAGGGGNGNINKGQPGTPNTGGGGGGSWYTPALGGSGIVVIRNNREDV